MNSLRSVGLTHHDERIQNKALLCLCLSIERRHCRALMQVVKIVEILVSRTLNSMKMSELEWETRCRHAEY